MFLSVVVPCFNEADNVLPLYEKVCSTLENKADDFEFVFINDGSKDETLANLKSICDSSSHPVKVVSFSRNFGKEAAIYAGLEHAEGDLISLIDADLQQDPEYIVKMVEYLNENPDEAYEMMAGGFEEVTAEDIAGDVEGLEFFGRAENEELNSSDTERSIKAISQDMADFWMEKGECETDDLTEFFSLVG